MARGCPSWPLQASFHPSRHPPEAIDKLLTVARQTFDYVVVDAGSRIDLRETAIFDESAILYLITQVGVSELRNSNRLITQFFSGRGRKLQIVLNRYTPHALLFDEKEIAKALTRPALWKIPDDYATARRTQNSARPVVLQDSPISRAIRQMARTACGLPATAEKKKGFFLFRRRKDKPPLPEPSHKANVWPLPDSPREEDEWTLPETSRKTAKAAAR